MADWGRHQIGKYPSHHTGHPLNTCLVWESIFGQDKCIVRYLIVPLFLGQIFLNYPLVADWGRQERGKYPGNLLGNPMNMCLVWESICGQSLVKINALFAELFNCTPFPGPNMTPRWPIGGAKKR